MCEYFMTSKFFVYKAILFLYFLISENIFFHKNNERNNNNMNSSALFKISFLGNFKHLIIIYYHLVEQ